MNIAIIVIVFAAAAGSAVLPLSALRHWAGKWRLVALLPLLVVVIWTAVILLSRSVSPDSHQLWPFEIFTWAMITMIYMVTMMTAKRMFEKKDAENAS
ncbi:MAG: hypothetical protein COA96_16060 [SAR86 cluster bacterium]|uniref:Uncharacterized protein n=1 Tax=SAR86 cluster bacterium TaxID=2030880 RepID=A0A2A5AL02_9GAMM|nr:MAG: hypothetical protein COA96_16060 [SAR86 cluster bacterium]